MKTWVCVSSFESRFFLISIILKSRFYGFKHCFRTMIQSFFVFVFIISELQVPYDQTLDTTILNSGYYTS